MTGKILGKISKAEYGTIRDYPMYIGLQLWFSLSDSSFCGDGGSCTVNISKSARWLSEADKYSEIIGNIERINSILADAKVNYVSELINKPVEVEIDKNTFKSFRILTEVL